MTPMLGMSSRQLLVNDAITGLLSVRYTIQNRNEKAPNLTSGASWYLNSLNYCFLNLRDAKPIKPKQKTASVDGSGT
jgi:hypothetical protein